jgi:hypothetical protein
MMPFRSKVDVVTVADMAGDAGIAADILAGLEGGVAADALRDFECRDGARNTEAASVGSSFLKRAPAQMKQPRPREEPGLQRRLTGEGGPTWRMSDASKAYMLSYPNTFPGQDAT